MCTQTYATTLATGIRLTTLHILLAHRHRMNGYPSMRSIPQARSGLPPRTPIGSAIHPMGRRGPFPTLNLKSIKSILSTDQHSHGRPRRPGPPHPSPGISLRPGADIHNSTRIGDLTLSALLPAGSFARPGPRAISRIS